MISDFKTPSIIENIQMPKLLGNNQHMTKTIVALDGGYGSIKGVSGDKRFCFPSIIKNISAPSFVDVPKETDIVVKDNETGKYYAVGGFAYKLMTSRDVSSMTDEYLYDRYRYQTEAYRILMGTGLCLGLPENYAHNEIYLQTGLPSEYLKRDTDEMKTAIAGHYDFSVKIGGNDYEEFCFDLPAERISVMEQPRGTLYNLTFDDKGNIMPENISIPQSNTIVYDGGFGTEDFFTIRAQMSESLSYSDTSMKSVYDCVLNDINRELPNPMKVFELQKYLENGEVTYYDRRTTSQKIIDISELVEKYNNKLCDKNIDRLMQTYDDLIDFQYLVVTGGTGESRYERIKEKLKNLSIKVVKGSKSGPLMFSNVMGYYLRLYAVLKKKAA